VHCSALLLGSTCPKLELLDVSFGSEIGLWSSLWFQYCHLFCYCAVPSSGWYHNLLYWHSQKGNKWLPKTASTDFAAMVLSTVLSITSEEISHFLPHVLKNLRSAELLVIWFTVSWSENSKFLLDREAYSTTELLGHTLGTRWSCWEIVSQVTFPCICYATGAQQAVTAEPWQHKGQLEIRDRLSSNLIFFLFLSYICNDSFHCGGDKGQKRRNYSALTDKQW